MGSAWAEATRTSLDAGHNFTNRYGTLIEIEPESLVARAVRMYFSRTRKRSWEHVDAWKKDYEGRPKPKAGPAQKRYKR